MPCSMSTRTSDLLQKRLQGLETRIQAPKVRRSRQTGPGSTVSVPKQLHNPVYFADDIRPPSLDDGFPVSGILPFTAGKGTIVTLVVLFVPSRVSPCRPQHRIVYIKTHKTGSSTVTNILERYGYLRGLNFALPKALSFSATKKFDPSQVYLNYLKDGNGSSIWPALGGFHLVVNHLRYNRKELEATIPNAVYVTIIREPASQFLSAMCYYKLGSQGKAKSMADTLDIALADPEKYLNVFARNGHAYDLGMDPASFSDPVAVNKTIESLSRELDLVMITEYFDESLILLKKLLCCDFEDILYIAKGVGKGCASRNITSDAREKIRRLNHVDVKLYQHFNRTFWDKVRDYGPTFQQDLRSFREIKEANTEMCLTGASERIDGHSAVVLRVGKNASEKCNNLFREDVQWVSILKRYMQNKSSTFVKGIDKRH